MVVHYQSVQRSLMPRRDLSKLNQDIAGRFRIEEGDAGAAMADTRFLVEQLHALLAQLVERAVDILDLEAKMEQALAFLLDPFRRAGLRP